MTKDITILDLFSGIGGFSLGLIKAGFKIKNHYFSEIDKYAIGVYKNQFKKAKYVGAVQNIIRKNIKRPDILTFGSPCQDFSIAGKRKGLEGQRSSLVIEAIRIIKETKPTVFIWENVKGTFSSNRGRDFQAILQAFTNIGGYRLEWQLLNTLWFLPQNRERIFLVGHLGGKGQYNIFPFSENDKLFNEKKKTKIGRTQTKNSSSTITGKERADNTFISVPKKAGALTNGGNAGGMHSDMTVIPVLTPGRKKIRQNGRQFKEDGEPAFTLTAQDMHGVLLGGHKKNRIYHNHSPTLTKRMGTGGNNIPLLKRKTDLTQLHTMGSSKPFRKCIGASRIPEVGNKDRVIRRLTEIECERLQGFPDDWTKHGIYDGEVKEVSRTQRYKMLGNAVTVNVVEAIGKRLIKLTKWKQK